MDYTYGATTTEDEDGWFIDFPDFDGGCFSDGETLEEACKGASEALRLTIATYLDDGKRLPAPTFTLPLQAVFTVEVTDEYVAETKCMTVKEAAAELGITAGRVSQLLNSGQLEAYDAGGKRLVTIASINRRKANPPAPHRPKRDGAAE